MLPWVECATIDLDLARPLSTRFDDVPQEAIEKGKQLLKAIAQEMPPAAGLLADAVRLRTGRRFYDEVQALARRFGVDWRATMLANISYDLALATFGCSAVALPTPAGPVLARNMDWWPEEALARASFRIRGFEDHRLILAHAGWPGAVGVVTGLSGRGFAVALNAVSGPEGVDKTGYPVLLHIRRVLDDAADFKAALLMLSEQRLAAPCLLTLVGVRNEERVVIERSPRRHALRWPQAGRALVVTNDYRQLFTPQAHDGGEIHQTTCTRFEALSRFFEQHTAENAVEDATLLYILSDPAVIQDITAQHVIMRPAQRELRVFVPRRLLDVARTSSP
ncbi:MAG TPA: C45 family peptidase [Phycisphaerae bacterium]|jgi:hypothetical protein